MPKTKQTDSSKRAIPTQFCWHYNQSIAGHPKGRACRILTHPAGTARCTGCGGDHGSVGNDDDCRSCLGDPDMRTKARLVMARRR